MVTFRPRTHNYNFVFAKALLREGFRVGAPGGDVILTNTKQRLSVMKADLSGSSFMDVNLSHCQFTNIAFSSVQMTDANLSGSQFQNVNLTGVAINHCTLTGMTINGVLVSELFAAYEAGKRG